MLPSAQGRAEANWACDEAPAGPEVASLYLGRANQPNHHTLQHNISRSLMPATMVNISQGFMSPSEFPQALNLSEKQSQAFLLAAPSPFPRCFGSSEADISHGTADQNKTGCSRLPGPRTRLLRSSLRHKAGSSHGGACGPPKMCSKPFQFDMGAKGLSHHIAILVLSTEKK